MILQNTWNHIYYVNNKYAYSHMADITSLPKHFMKPGLRNYTTIQNWLIRRDRGLVISTWNPDSHATTMTKLRAGAATSAGTGSRGTSGYYSGTLVRVSEIYRDGTIYYVIGVTEDGVQHKYRAMWRDHYANPRHPHHETIEEVDKLITKEVDQRHAIFYKN